MEHFIVISPYGRIRHGTHNKPYYKIPQNAPFGNWNLENFTEPSLYFFDEFDRISCRFEKQPKK